MRPEDELAFAKVLTHELIHLNAFQSINVKSEDESDFNVRNRRGGLRVVSNTEDFDKYYFDNLDEAVTEELAHRFIKAFFNKIPELKEFLKSREKIKENEGFEGESVDISIVSVLRGKGFWASYMIDSSSHVDEREYLWKLIDELYEINQDKFNSKEEIFDFFARAALSGKLLPLARLIESSKGKGSFRIIGEETSNIRPNYEITINTNKKE